MSTVPAPPPGTVAVIVVASMTANELASFTPNFTADALVNAVPVMVTVFPPAITPADGLTLDTVGTSA